jgi:predicted ABC-type transport system involved in lysophospholipase L1 biosynthesis ATPase subunit
MVTQDAQLAARMPRRITLSEGLVLNDSAEVVDA